MILKSELVYFLFLHVVNHKGSNHTFKIKIIKRNGGGGGGGVKKGEERGEKKKKKGEIDKLK